jgi:hypothetical protein
VKQVHETEVFRAFIEAGRSKHQGGGAWFHFEAGSGGAAEGAQGWR